MNLFVYGTLMYPDLYREITGALPIYEPARLRDFSVRCLYDRPYPGLVADPGAEAIGFLIRGVNESTMQQLDVYEGEEYERRWVRVLSGVDTVTYVLRKKLLYLASLEEWKADPERLEKR